MGLPEPPWLAAYRSALLTIPGVVSCENAAEDSGPRTVRLSVTVSGTRSWDLRVTFEHPRLTTLPTITLCGSHGLLAHINRSRTVCYDDGQSVVIDPSRGPEAVARAVSSAVALLEKSAHQQASGDYSEFLVEFEGYWASLPEMARAESFVVINGEPREVVAVTDISNFAARCRAFVERNSFGRFGYRGLMRFNSFPRTRALYIPLSKPVLPPAPPNNLDVSFLRELCEALPPNQRRMLETFSSEKGVGKRWTYVLLSQPRPSGGYSLFGLAVAHKHKGSAFDHGLVIKVRPLGIQRHVAEYMRPRGGARGSLEAAHVAVVGCGAVGARIAEFLALAGVGTLTLLDPEEFSADNVYRHILGGESVGAHKVDALAVHLRHRLPSITVNPRPERWKGETLPADIDAVVLALGDPNQERELNGHWRAESQAKPKHMVVSWLEAAGLGGHAVLSTVDSPGCLECVYRDASGEIQSGPKVSYLEFGQAVGRNLTGCGGSFTPFSALDAVKTASLASELVIETLLGRRNSGYLTWRGADTEAASNGLRVTPWYQRAAELSAVDLSACLFSCRCPVCGATP